VHLSPAKPMAVRKLASLDVPCRCPGPAPAPAGDGVGQWSNNERAPMPERHRCASPLGGKSKASELLRSWWQRPSIALIGQCARPAVHCGRSSGTSCIHWITGNRTP